MKQNKTKTYEGMTFLIKRRLYTNLLLLLFIIIMVIIAKIEQL